MVPSRSYTRGEGWVLITLALILLCPVTSYKRLQVTQTDEDLIFDDEDSSFESHSRWRRQAFSSSGDGDEEDIEGSGYPPDSNHVQTYRCKFLINKSHDERLTNKNSPEFKESKQKIEEHFTLAFDNDFRPNTVIPTVVSIDYGDWGKQEVTMDIIDENQNNEKLLRKVVTRSLESSGLDFDYSSLVFEKITDRSWNRCEPGQMVCPEGTCATRCNGLKECGNGEDEENCVDLETNAGGKGNETAVDCSSQEIKCDGAICVSLSKTCDGTRDCRDGSDEDPKYCPPVPEKCSSDEFRCRDGSCIPSYKRCDYVEDCPDNDDEEFCPRLCQPGEHQCGDGGICISIDYKCDGKFDCDDQSDERGCACREDQFNCDIVQCIPHDKICDQNVDCQDGSDEYNCSTPPSCRIDQFRCDDGSCLNMDQRCNSQIDCSHGEDERHCSCRPDQFKCLSGICIEASKKCDGNQDCPQSDNSDELNCPDTGGFNCSSTEFPCNSGECVDLLKRCDQNYDCLDQSDETGCPPVTTECKPDQHDCNDGTCIHKSWKCDEVVDCLDGSDEMGCACKANQFACGDGKCISESLMCDSAQDCSDGSDERSCPCTSDDFTCRTGECIPLSYVCNNLDDCIDASDEENCANCASYEFQCSSGECIFSTQRCNDNRECADGSDELGCAVLTCKQGEERCIDSGECIARNMLCNGKYDCEDSSDERFCACSSFEFHCNSGECISQATVCDQRNDCLDNSDEHNCPGPTGTPSCDSREFKCSDGSCISNFSVCDGRNDCNDGLDERRCEYECSRGEFQCNDGQCVSESVYCDGRVDCLDGSDEASCTTPKPTIPSTSYCRTDEFRCNSGNCILESLKCDGKFDCRDQSDESSCPSTSPRPRCRSNEFECRSGECIDSYRHCDQRFDCYDRSDEENCPLERCRQDQFRCRNGDCIDARRKCDGSYDCRDYSDEDNCPKEMFTCYNGVKIPLTQKCDGRQDCPDGSDERGCPEKCAEGEFHCSSSNECISKAKVCDDSFDCIDRSDEGQCGPQPPEVPTDPSGGLSLMTYPDEQTIKQSREVVFQCRDEGPQRKPVRWLRSGGQRLPPGSTDIRGRLTIPNIQLDHAGSYICEAQGVPPNSPGNNKNVFLHVVPFSIPTVSPPIGPVCSSIEATCYSGQCILKEQICDGDYDCDDQSDEARCDPLGCEPNEFQCDNKQCVGKAWVCDSDDDCGDGSDERSCDGPSSPNSNCTKYEFSCKAGNQCIPRSFQCDNEIDCQDRSDEVGCSKPIIIEPLPRIITIEATVTFNITCRAIGIPTPVVVWRLNWGHVPPSCSMTSDNGFGVLTCTNAQPHHQGAYSCEAINSLGSVFAAPDAIVQVTSTETTCAPPKFNFGAISERDCLDCFCFGITDVCHSSEKHVSQLPPPLGDSFQIVGVNQDQFQGNYVIRDRDYPLSSRYLRQYSNSGAVKLEVRDRNRLGGPSDLLIYFALPVTHRGSQLTAYGSYLRYNVEFASSRGRLLKGPDVIIKGNNMTIMHVHDYSFTAGRRNQIDIRFWPGQWYKRVINRGGRVQSQEPASRWEIMTALEDIELFLIRASYMDSTIDTTLSDVQLDTAVFRFTEQGRAIYVEECTCPTGYAGSSCEDCAPNSRRVLDGPYKGRCVLDVSCGPGEYGNPANGIPCLACPCPLTNIGNQFGSSCYLDTNGQVTCNCQVGYEGRRCQSCAEGYEGNPNIPGESCQPAGKCDPVGSIYPEPNPATGICQCKDFVVGPKCSMCQPGSFYLHESNQYGCIECFCMGITNLCSSSQWYRSQESVNFVSSTEGLKLVDQYQSNVISSNLFADTGTQELVYRGFSGLSSDIPIYYWKLPQKFLGDKVHSYGGNLTYTLRYIPTPGGQSSKNNAYDVEIYGNDVTLRYFSKQRLIPGVLDTITVPFYEHDWQRQDGQIANREHFLMALADLEYILIKATYTTNTEEVGLKEIKMSIAVPRNTGHERAFAVEMCDCPEGYIGLSCEDCDVGFTRGLSGLHLGTCERCNCNGYSNECDSETGSCYNCRDNRAGQSCESCADGYYMGFNGRCERVESCSCDIRGSLSTQCVNDQCQCKNNVEGDQCNSCKEGNFYLSETNKDGCLKCWCSGVTGRCSSSQYYREEIPMNLFHGHGFTLSDRLRTNVIDEDFEIDIPENKISYSRFNDLSPQTTYYWSLPQMFTGNLLTSYGGQLSITQNFDSRSASDIYADADIIISSSDKREFIWMNPNSLKPRQVQNYTLRLVEHEFTVDQRPASREEFLSALSSVEAILIRAQFSESMVSSSLQYVVMETAVDYQSGKARAFEVEQCSCPNEYVGFSCEDCAQGYYKDLRSNHCLKCPCNGKEESCVAERNGNVKCNCMKGFKGANCGVSGGTGTRPIPGVLEIIIREATTETRVGSTVELECRVEPIAGPRVSIRWDKAGGTLPYGRAYDNNEGILSINQIRPEDAGTYICRASQGLTVAEKSTELIVTGGAPPSKPVVNIEERQDIRLSIGQYFSVRCRASGSPVPNVQWFRADGRPLSATATQQDGVLVISDPSPSDSGAYICRGSNRVGTTSATITIYIEDYLPPLPTTDVIIVQVSEEEVQVFPGETVRVTCSVPNSLLRASFTWTRVNEDLPEQSTQQNGLLIIPNARPIDSGLYTCRVSDDRGRFGESTTRVVVEFTGNTPVVRIEPDRQAVNQGTNAEMKCVASGFPAPELTWSKANEEMSQNVRIDGPILRIENAIVNDRGLYICTATNNVGSARSTAIVEVERRESPVIEMYPDSRRTIERGSSAMFQCHLTGGIPTPTVTWNRADGRPLTSNTVTLNGGVLRFNHVTGDEEGSYICTAVNNAGRMTAIATLEIQAQPVITMRPSASPYKVQVGQKIYLDCSAEGDPTPSVRWQKLQVNFEQDVPGRSLTSSRSVYEIERADASHQGTYQCTAVNSAGTSIERIQVLVEDNLPVYTPLAPYPQPSPSRPSSEPYQVPLGGEFQFRCYAEGAPQGNVNELLFDFERSDGRQLPRDHTEGNGILTVSNVEREAAGEYACIVKEKITNQVILTIYATLEVVEQPRVRLEPTRQIVHPGDTVSLRCIVTGAQPISINWSKESGSMPQSVIINRGELMFRGIATTDTGKYICEAVNSVGRATSVAEVIVNEMPLLTALKEQMTVSENQNVQLRCEASGVNPELVRWSKDEGNLPRNAYPSGTLLRISKARPEDSGRYKCEARTPNGVFTYDFINLNVRSNTQAVDLQIRASTTEVRLGSPLELFCDVTGDPYAVVVWSKQGDRLPHNSIPSGRSLRFNSIQPNNGGIFICTATTASGVTEKQYPLVIQNFGLVDPNTYEHGSRSVKTRSVQFETPITLNCGIDLLPPVSYSWSKQGGELPIRARVENDKIEIPNVQADDAGTYICTGRNNQDQDSIEVPFLLIVTGVVPSFSGESYLALPTLQHAYLEFNLEISFKPESPNGLIMYNSQRDGLGDFISFGIVDGYAEFRFDVGSGPVILKSEDRLEMGQWHTVKLGRNKREGTMIVNDGNPIFGESTGRFKGLELRNPLYIGGVPDFSVMNNLSGFSSGFEGCVGRFVIGSIISELMRDARAKHRIQPCDTCGQKPCSNGGVCQEAYSVKGHKCICPAGFSGDACESTGESCYPGVCGTGRCIDTPGGLECTCPFGKTGPRCGYTIDITEPAFARGAYMAYATPRALKSFSFGMNIKPESLEDGILMYCSQQERGDGDFVSLTLRNKRLEFKFNTGTGTATLQSDQIVPGNWIKVKANRTDKVGALQVNDGPMKNGQSPGPSRSLNLGTPLYIGGIDQSKIEVAPDVQVSKAFTGCISEIEVMDLTTEIADSIVESANVDQCGSSSCDRKPCKNEGQCSVDPEAEGGFTCNCSYGFSGYHCEVEESGVCVGNSSCLNGGVCGRHPDAYNHCLCPLLYYGPTCEEESDLGDSISFDKRSWIEVDRYHLPQDGIVDQEVLITFTTNASDGLLLWHGQEPSTRRGWKEDYLSLGIKNGYLEFSFYVDQNLRSVLSASRVDDDQVHTVHITKNYNAATLQLDNDEPQVSKLDDFLFLFNTLGNIYLGGVPDLLGMTGPLYNNGFSGCIHDVVLGVTRMHNFMDYALDGVNVAPCSRGR